MRIRPGAFTNAKLMFVLGASLERGKCRESLKMPPLRSNQVKLVMLLKPLLASIS